MGAVVCFAAAFLLLIGAGLPKRAEFTGYTTAGTLSVAPEMGAVAPPFETSNLAEQRVRLLDMRGQPVIINFWATWCVPCRAEMPELEAIYADYKGRVAVLAVNLGEQPGLVREWREQLRLTFGLLLDPAQTVGALYAVRGLPSTYVVSPQGIISQVFFGPTNRASLQAALAPFFINQ